MFLFQRGVTLTSIRRIEGRSASVVSYTLAKAKVGLQPCERSALPTHHGTGRRRCRLCSSTICQGWGDFCCLCGIAILDGEYDAELADGKLQSICDGFGG